MKKALIGGEGSASLLSQLAAMAHNRSREIRPTLIDTIPELDRYEKISPDIAYIDAEQREVPVVEEKGPVLKWFAVIKRYVPTDRENMEQEQVEYEWKTVVRTHVSFDTEALAKEWASKQLPTLPVKVLHPTFDGHTFSYPYFDQRKAKIQKFRDEADERQRRRSEKRAKSFEKPKFRIPKNLKLKKGKRRK